MLYNDSYIIIRRNILPPQQKVTKELLVKAGYFLTQEIGIENINARNLAKEVGCSTQPIFSQFESIEEVKQAIHDYACVILEDKITEYADSKNIIVESSLILTTMAREQKEIFKLIFMSPYCLGKNFMSSRLDYSSNQKILKSLKENYSLSEKQAANILERISLFVHGIATIMATSNFTYTDKQIKEMVSTTLIDMIKGFSKSTLSTQNADRKNKHSAINDR